MIFFVVQDDSYYSIAEYIENRAPSSGPKLALLFYPELAFRRTLPLGTYVFCALDRLTDAEREITLRAWETLADCGSPVRLLNHPTKTLLRYDLLRGLHGSGLNRFQVYRATETRRPERYPVFLRLENEHTGDIGGILQNRTQLYAALARAALLGYHRNELLIVEFCRTATAEGFFRKYSAFIVGDKVLPRSFQASRHWVVKADGQYLDESLVMEERRFVRENPHETMLREIFRNSHTEYGRIDYGMLGDQLQVWEINLGPTISRRPLAGPSSPMMEKFRPLREEARLQFYRCFDAALEGIDGDVDARGEIPFVLPEGLRERFKQQRRQQRRAMLHRNFVERVTYCSMMQRAKRLAAPVMRKAAPVLNRAGGTT